MPTCCSMSTLVSNAPIRLCARGPSGTLTASTPASLSFRTSATIRDASTPRGGTISTDVTNSPAAMRDAKRDRSANGVERGGVAPVLDARPTSRVPRPDIQAWIEWADPLADRLDVLGGCSAAAAEDLGAGVNEMARVG